METESSTQKKNTFKIPYGQSIVIISGDFDSGNLNSACIDLEKQEIQLTFGKDKEIKPSSKCWFYFSLQSQVPVIVKLYLLKTNVLTVASKVYDLYRPVVREEGGMWERYAQPIDFQVTTENDINFHMTVELREGKKTYVALCYPWSFQENEDYFQELGERLSQREDLYYNQEVLIYSPEKRPIHLIALSAADVTKYPQQKYISNLFPLRESQNHFREVHKPLILITSRVHPGQIGSSYSLRGMIQFLVGKDEEAAKILKEFYFLIIPMLNPDGVFNGNNRMDALGQNLNRFYHLPDLIMQPSCFAVKSLVENTRNELFAFFDLHGHANKKSCFLFGNSINNTRFQIQSILFAKYLSSICEFIEFKSCNFSKKQMSSKDKNQDLSKEGCARVVVHRWTSSPYCYTLETGLFKNVKVDEKGIFRYGQKFYSPEIYEEVGAKMIFSLFQILRKNKHIDEMRKFCADYVIRMQKISSKKEKTKQEKQKTQKSIKSVKSEETEQELSKKQIQEKENDEIKTSDSNEKLKEIESVLHRNKIHLLKSNQDQDDE